MPVMAPGGMLTAFQRTPLTYSASATTGGGTKTSSGTQVYTDLVLEGGDGTGVTTPDPGGAGATLLVNFTANFNASAHCAYFFQLIVDGVVVVATGPYSTSLGPPEVGNAAMVKTVTVAAGSTHVVKVKWKSNAGQLTIDPTLDGSANSPNHATLVVQMIPS